MEVILSIVFVVSAVSVYDFYSARKWQQTTSDVRNNIVFQNRNKEYGAYVIRRDYDKNMVYILLGLIASISIIFASFYFLKNTPKIVLTTPIVEPLDPPIIYNVVDKIIPITKKQNDDSGPKTDKFVEMLVVDKKVETKILTADELEKLKAGSLNKGKDSSGTILDPVLPLKIIKKDPPITYEVPIFTDVEAFFNGSLSSFIQKRLVYPQIAIEENKQGKCYLKFIVNVDGTVSDVSIVRGVPDCPECDKEALRVVKQMKDWIPGKNQGKNVRSWMQLPINFTLE